MARSSAAFTGWPDSHRERLLGCWAGCGGVQVGGGVQVEALAAL
jgi:hypothetical protein